MLAAQLPTIPLTPIYPLQASTLPFSAISGQQFDIGSIMNLMLPMMIVMMMVGMMGKMISSSPQPVEAITTEE